MKITERVKNFFVKSKERLVFKRESEMIIDRPSFYTTLAAGAIVCGFLWGIAGFCYVGNVSPNAEKTIAITGVSVIMALGLIWEIYLLFPFLASKEQPVWLKILRPIGGLLTFAASFVAGLYLFGLVALVITFLIVGAIIYFVLKLVGVIAEDEYKLSEADKITLDDGTELTKKGWSGNHYKGNDGHDYERTEMGTFEQVS